MVGTRQVKKQLRTVHMVYCHSRPIEGATEIVNVRDLESPISIPSINKVLDEIELEVRQNVKNRYGVTAYPVMRSYNPVETDVDLPCYCFECKKGFMSKTIYGISFTSQKCPKGHTKTTDKSWGRCTKCKKGNLWQTTTKTARVECVVHCYKCDYCGTTASEPID